MEINKQLFEEVLSGKLKGTFVLRNKRRISSSELISNNFYYSETHPCRLREVTYTFDGLSSLNNLKSNNDIIDFIPDTNMKENELTIEIPDNKVVDWDESKKQNKIILKDKQLTYHRDIIKHTEISTIHNIHYFSDRQISCLLAKNKLANVAKYLNDGWKPKSGDIVFGLMLEGENQSIIFPAYNWNTYKCFLPQFTFKTLSLAKQAIEILGEEAVKLALEPLGI